MNTYKCVVYDEDKKKRTLNINTNSKDKLNEYAVDNNLKIVKVKNSNKIDNKEKIKQSDMKVLCRQMSILIESGCEITKVLTILIQQSSLKVSNVIRKIHDNIQSGNSVTESFRKTDLFSNFFISMIRAGEVSGRLDKVLENLAEYYEKESSLKSKISNILVYPIILTITSICVTLFTIIFVIPNFQIVFEGNGVNPPLVTKILIDISIFVKKYIVHLIIIISAISISLIYYLKRSTKLRIKINTIVFKIFYIKDLFKIIIAAKFSRSLYILINSGVQIVDAIQISSNVLDNEFASERLSIAIEYIKKGNSIGESLNLSNIFPNMFISMIKIGEESGKLDDSLNSITKYYEDELDAKTQKFITYIQPIIIMILGVIIGGVLMSIVTPMFDMVNAI